MRDKKENKILNAKMSKQVKINFYAENQQPSPISSVQMALSSLYGKIYRELSQEEKQTIQYTSSHVAICKDKNTLLKIWDACMLYCYLHPTNDDAAWYAHFDLLKNWLDRIEIIFKDDE